MPGAARRTRPPPVAPLLGDGTVASIKGFPLRNIHFVARRAREVLDGTVGVGLRATLLTQRTPSFSEKTGFRSSPPPRLRRTSPVPGEDAEPRLLHAPFPRHVHFSILRIYSVFSVLSVVELSWLTKAPMVLGSPQPRRARTLAPSVISDSSVLISAPPPRLRRTFPRWGKDQSLTPPRSPGAAP